MAFAETLQPSGWDYNLAKRCVKSTNPSAANYFADAYQCTSDGKRWTIAVQSEQTLGVSCPGPVTQSFGINVPGSPVTLNWLPHTDEFGRTNWSINLKTDLAGNTHPCGANYFTWFMLMDHAGSGGGPLPLPDRVKFSATVNFNDYVPNGATRAIALWQGFWNGKSHSIEMSMQGSNWGDNYPDDPKIIDVKTTDTMNFIAISGPAYGVQLPKQVDTRVDIAWNSIIQDLVNKGLLPAPAGGWGNSATTAVGMGHEVHNFSPNFAVVGDIWFTNFRIENAIPSFFGSIRSFFGSLFKFNLANLFRGFGDK